MRGRRQQAGLPSRARWTAGATGLAVAATAVAVALIPAGSASAKPAANYHAGSDKAVFTVTGVEDSNCLVSTGGSTVYIKPGDRVDFSTGLAGIALNGLNLQGGQLAGLNVTAKIDGGTKKGGRTISVPGGKTVKVRDLSTGTHTLAWTAKSVRVVIPAVSAVVGLLGKIITPGKPAHPLDIPLSSSQLKSGADFSWTGKIFVTPNAAKCTISVQTPTTHVSAGPLHVTVPGQNITVPGATVPTKVSGIPSLGSSGGSSGTPSSSSPSTSTGSFAPPALTVPQMVVPQGAGGAVYNGGGGGGYDLGVTPDNGSSTQLSGGDTSTATASNSGSGSSSSSSPADSTGRTKTVDLASDASGSSVSGTLPVVLAIVAVLVLAMVAGTYARLYLLGRNSK